MSWYTPIINRTAVDLLQARQQVKQWRTDINNGKTVTMTDLKGALNINDLNRIEGNISYLYSQLIALEYTLTQPGLITWGSEDIPNGAKITSLLEKLEVLNNRMRKTTLPTEIINYLDINTVEILTKEVKDILDNLLKKEVYAGSAVSGVEAMI